VSAPACSASRPNRLDDQQGGLEARE
jgi:hypothetical protein